MSFFFWWDGPNSAPASGTTSSPSGTLSGPVARIGPERRLPHWIPAATDPTALLARLFGSVAENRVQLAGESRRVFAQRFLGEARLGEPRYQWSIPFAHDPGEELVLTAAVDTLDGPVAGTVRRARSRFDFDTAPDPVWWSERQDHQLWVRNLDSKERQLADGRGVYTIGGESAPLVPDGGFFYRRDPTQVWDWLSPDSPLVSGASFALPTSGTWRVRYRSETLRSALGGGTLTVTHARGRSVPFRLTALPYANIFDAYGELLGQPRLTGEDNRTYRNRLLAAVLAPPDSSAPGLTRGVAGRLGLLEHRSWNGISDLVLDSGGSGGITAIHVVGQPALRAIQETLTPVDNGARCYASYGAWLPGALVTVNGIPVVGAAVSGNVVTLPIPASGRVEAQYGIRQYGLPVGPGGGISGIQAGTGISSGSYDLLIARHVTVSAVDLPAVQVARFLTAAGLPNALLLELARALTPSNRTTWGRARWQDAAWTAAAETRPGVAHLPVPFDQQTP